MKCKIKFKKIIHIIKGRARYNFDELDHKSTTIGKYYQNTDDALNTDIQSQKLINERWKNKKYYN